MPTFLLAAYLLASLVTNAASQHVSGPTAVKSVVNGVPITIHVTSRLDVKSVGDDVVVNTRILVDLFDLQRNFSRIVGTFAPPADLCANRRSGNESPIAVLKNGSLWPRDDHLVMFVRGHVDIWSCIPKGRKTVIRWQKKKIAFVGVKVPKLVTLEKVVKRKVGSQPFHGSLDISLRGEESNSISLQAGRARTILGGHERVVTDENLRNATAKIAQDVTRALGNVIGLAKLKQALPEELRASHMTVVSTRFRGFGGHAIAEVGLEARARAREERGAQRLQQLVAQLSN